MLYNPWMTKQFLGCCLVVGNVARAAHSFNTPNLLSPRLVPSYLSMADVSDSELKAAYEDVRTDASETNWVVFGYEGNTKIVKVGSGSGGLEELKAVLADDQVQYGYLRVVSGDSESKRAKFVFISWVGEKVGPLKRAKVSVHKANVKSIIQSFGVEIHAEKQEELDAEEIMNRVKKAGGADYSGNLAHN